MENNAIPAAPIGANTKPVAWSRCNRELTGRSGRSYIHGASQLLMQSYTEIRAVPHEYHIIHTPCRTYSRHFISFPLLRMIYDEPPHVSEGLLTRGVLPNIQLSFSSLGVSALDFNTKGTYLASVTRSGCLSVHNYESLYNRNQEEDENEPAWHGFLVDHQGLSAIRWNPIEQAEIAFSSWRNEELILYDLAFAKPTHKLRTPENDLILKGYSDIAFVNEGTRVLASDFSGAVNMWDLRAGGLPKMVLTSERNISVTSIDSHGNQFVCGASKSGYIHTWDLRGGRSSSNALQSANEAHSSSPMASINLKSMLNKLGPLKPKTNVLQKVIQSISVNPSCSYQLGFHLADGCSGVFDMHNSRVSHIHCPPRPPWLSNTLIPVLPSRRPSWLDNSIYAAASTSSNGLYLLDFNPHRSSPCHVDNDKSPQERVEHDQGIFVPLSLRATACATHPLDGTIAVGTMRLYCWFLKRNEDYDDEDEWAYMEENPHYAKTRSDRYGGKICIFH